MPALQVPVGVEGVVSLFELPDPAWRNRWTRIVVPDATKQRLLNFTVLSLLQRGRFDDVRLPIHGLIVLAGPPGTGKTTLAHGLANEAAQQTNGALFVEVDPHAFPSQLLGESQRGVARLFGRTIPDIASRGRPTVVLLDEVEALAVSRSGASLETNPVDVHRATDALLEGVDQVARTCPNVTFVATTNLMSGVDAAFLSRADVIETFDLPAEEAVIEILRDTIESVAPAALNGESLHPLAREITAAQLDARQIRKLVLKALASRPELAREASKLRVSDVAAVLRAK